MRQPIKVKPENICTPVGRCGLQPHRVPTRYWEGGFPPVTGKGHRVLCKSNYGIYYKVKINLTFIIFCSILNSVAKKELTFIVFCSILHTVVWGCSSVGRASGLQPEGQRFKSAHLHPG